MVALGARVRLVSSLTGSQWIATGYNLAMTRHFFMDEGRFCLLTYSRGSACWHGLFGLSPLLARPAALRDLLVSMSFIHPVIMASTVANRGFVKFTMVEEGG